VRRLSRYAARAGSASLLGLEVPLLLLWALLASILSAIAANVRDWNAMSDELVYERLAISVGQLHSPLPHLHGEVVRSLAQLYPLLISPWFAAGYVPHDLVHAHIFDAWLMSSACIPAFLLARRVTGRRWAAYLLALVTICTPWIVYTTTLLTEVAGFPAFMWAMLGIHHAATRPSWRSDLLAVLGVALAFFARTQFVGLIAVLPAALLVYHASRHELRAAARRHLLLVCVYVVLAVAAAAAVVSGHRLSSLSVYGNLNPGLFPAGWEGSVTGHLADLAFGIGILPLVVGVAWLIANVLRPPAAAAAHAFACIAAATTTVVVLEISAWDLGPGTFVIDRFLFYLAPLLLLAFVCALLDARKPRWSLLLPAALVAWGFARHLQKDFLWSGQFPLSTDSPIALPYKWFADLGGGKSGASAILVCLTIGATVAFVAAARFVRPAVLTAVLAILLAVALPADTTYAFAKLFSRDGHAVRPLTQSEAGILDWLDRAVGTGAKVTAAPYAVSTAHLVTLKFWRDLEFWNKSVRYGIHYPPGLYADAVIWFPNNAVTFDRRSGRASRSLTPFVVQAVGETRFRISGTARLQTTDVMLIQASMPWRTDWLTSGLYGDGWTPPHTTAHIHVFATPGQRGPVMRTLTVQLRAPNEAPDRPFAIAWRHGSIRARANDQNNVVEQIPLCVPGRGFADVRVSSPVSSDVGPDQSQLEPLPHRPGGVLVADISLADEIGGPCKP
jgi:hypothetical protein